MITNTNGFQVDRRVSPLADPEGLRGRGGRGARKGGAEEWRPAFRRNQLVSGETQTGKPF